MGVGADAVVARWWRILCLAGPASLVLAPGAKARQQLASRGLAVELVQDSVDVVAGAAAGYGGGELRARLFGLSLGVPGDLGFVALTDVGRIWLDGERSGRWHTAWGGGLRGSLNDSGATLSAPLADGERTMLYVRGGFAF